MCQVVTARAKYNRMTGTVLKDQPLEVFGHWQTEKYIPPPAKDGKVRINTITINHFYHDSLILMLDSI